eukprot:gnl/TRDRNA2_/TRDRNA2_163026_c3_seq2.p1 gnl/TRDRNA2_/TRDRNA2_163026_c3~~gnl/TRDRNA2_/TRDRNA2_163026_c3_seq2.p1  ORF type:complete len:551 (+),score=53.53 gnl/TRDRNA2_/TRDRNA2_163026_c3_seq2:44-1654(+)
MGSSGSVHSRCDGSPGSGLYRPGSVERLKLGNLGCMRPGSLSSMQQGSLSSVHDGSLGSMQYGSLGSLRISLGSMSLGRLGSLQRCRSMLRERLPWCYAAGYRLLALAGLILAVLFHWLSVPISTAASLTGLSILGSKALTVAQDSKAVASRALSPALAMLHRCLAWLMYLRQFAEAIGEYLVCLGVDGSDAKPMPSPQFADPLPATHTDLSNDIKIDDASELIAYPLDRKALDEIAQAEFLHLCLCWCGDSGHWIVVQSRNDVWLCLLHHRRRTCYMLSDSFRVIDKDGNDFTKSTDVTDDSCPDSAELDSKKMQVIEICALEPLDGSVLAQTLKEHMNPPTERQEDGFAKNIIAAMQAYVRLPESYTHFTEYFDAIGEQPQGLVADVARSRFQRIAVYAEPVAELKGLKLHHTVVLETAVGMCVVLEYCRDGLHHGWQPSFQLDREDASLVGTHKLHARRGYVLASCLQRWLMQGVEYNTRYHNCIHFAEDVSKAMRVTHVFEDDFQKARDKVNSLHGVAALAGRFLQKVGRSV